MDIAGLQAWIGRAAAGDSVVYASGDPSRAMLAAARAAGAAGLVVLNFTRAPVSREGRYVATRTAVPAVPIAAPHAPLRTSPEGRILRALTEAARAGRPCPSNLALARRAGLQGRVCASYRVRKLVRAGLIAVDMVGPDRQRVVTIAATGLMTAGGAQ